MTPRVAEDAPIARAVATVVRDENATLVVVGHRPGSAWRHRVRPSVADQVAPNRNNVDLYLAKLDDDAG